jgi:CHAT domain-containing protein/Flp pilus assembly protein TadD
MNPFPDSGRPTPRPRRSVSRAFPALLAVLLCGAGGIPPVAGPPLEDGLTLEKEIRGGEVHAYPVELQAGQFLRVVVQEDGIDIALRLFDPKGTEVTGADGLIVGQEEEDLSAVADVSGPYRVEIKASSRPDRGRYRLGVQGPRQPEPEDRWRAEATQAMWSGFKGGPRVEEERQRQQIRSLEQALSLWERLREDRRAAEALFGLGIKRNRLSDYGQAAEEFWQSAELWGSQPDPIAKSWQARALNSGGTVLKKLGRWEEARKSFERALSVARQFGDGEMEVVSLSNLGLFDSEQGELRRGIDFELEGLELARKGGYRAQEASLLNNLAYAYDQLADKQKALQYYQESLALARNLLDREAEAAALNNLAEAYGSLGDWETALEQYQKAIELIRARPEQALEAKTLNNIAVAYQRLGRFDEARTAFDQALALSRAVKDLEAQTSVLNNQAFLFLRLKQPDRAVEPARQALLLAGSFREREANALFALGSAHLELGDLTVAKQELQKALTIAQARGDRRSEAELSLALARVEEESGNLMAALDLVRPAIEIIESLRAKVVNQDLKASFLAAKQNYYELEIDTLMALHQARKTGGFAAQAFQASERARARGLLEILHEAGADIREGADPKLIEREHRLRDEVNERELYRLNLLSRETPEGTQLAEAERRLKESLEEYRKVQDELRVSSPGYAALTQPQPLNVKEVQSQVLEGGALLLEYKLGEKRSFLWAVSPDSVESFELPARDVIEKTALKYYELLTTRNQKPRSGESYTARKARIADADREAERVAGELSAMILQPVKSRLGTSPLLIVADGFLQYIPFAALPISSSGAPLATLHIVVNLPSASTLAVQRRELRDRPRAPKALAVLADPVFDKDDDRLTLGLPKLSRPKLASSAIRGGGSPAGERGAGMDQIKFRRLLSSGKEAKTISALVLPDQRFLALGFGASRATATSAELGLYRIVHFATHGVIDSRRPELSSLVLSLFDQKGKAQDGFLRLNHIYNLRLNADLVVLSACQTALGKELRGEGLVGLTRGFMYAGSARVLASLWSIEDRPTAELMERFYRGMLREGLSPAEALRRAQLEMAKNPLHKSPYYWAGFSLQGEWR